MNDDFEPTGPESEHVYDLLSAYIDNSLDSEEHEWVRAHLEECADCRGDYIELRATQHILHSLPTVPPPRAFTLTEQDVAALTRKPGFLQRLLTPRNSPRFAFGSVLAFGLLVLILVGNLLTSYGTTSSADLALAPAPSSSEARQGNTAGSQAAPGAALAEPTQAPAEGLIVPQTNAESTSKNPPIAKGYTSSAPTANGYRMEVPRQTPALGNAGLPAGGAASSSTSQ